MFLLDLTSDLKLDLTQKDRQTDGGTDRQTDGRMGGSMDRWMDGRTDKQTNRWKISPFYRTLSPIGAAALPPPMKTDEKVEQGKGTADHLMPLGYFLFNVY